MKHDFDMEKILAHIRTAEKKKFVLDTDTFNEIDDQFAVTYAMIAPDIDLLALTAAPFFNFRSTSPEDGMEKSYAELLNVRGKVDPTSEVPCYLGSCGYLENTITPRPSEAADAIIRLAHETYAADDILYVACIGCFTNVASALLKDPSIAEKIVVILIGGNQFELENANEFNLEQDRAAARVIFECGVPVVLLPAMHCTEHLRTTTGEVAYYLGNGQAGQIGDYLVSLFEHDEGKAFDENENCNSRQRTIWDIGSVAFLRGPDRFCGVEIKDSHTIDAQGMWRTINDGRKMIYVHWYDRNAVFTDFFTTVRNFYRK